jgi:hypothetical protein
MSQQNVSQQNEGDTEETMESSAMNGIDGLNKRSISENGWYRPNTKRR